MVAADLTDSIPFSIEFNKVVASTQSRRPRARSNARDPAYNPAHG
jgi:hypothetical protein